MPFRLWPGTVGPLPFLLRTMVFFKVEMQSGVKGLLPYKAVILRLMEDFATRKSSNEHGFFAVVTSLNKICEWRIQDLTGDTPFL